jgi:folate-dependent phosphoribosylglycinamide formyltransferase PurN/transcription termination factor NusB
MRTHARHPVFQPLSLKDAAALQELATLAPDVMIVAAYGLILPPAVLAIPRHGCINVHASVLPRWRGAAPIERAIEAGDTSSGVTIMQMDAGLDTGAMLLVRECPVMTTDTGATLRERLGALGAEALLETLALLRAGRLEPVAQDDALATYASKLRREEAEIDWQLDAAAIARRVRAFNPANVCQTSVDGQILRVWLAEATDSCHHRRAGLHPTQRPPRYSRGLRQRRAAADAAAVRRRQGHGRAGVAERPWRTVPPGHRARCGPLTMPRTCAARAIAAVIGNGITLDEALERSCGSLEGRDRALAREIAFGVCRRYFELDALLAQLMDRPLKSRDVDVRALLLVGLYQLRHMRVPDHAAVSETVAASKPLGKPWARGLVNAVLRAYLARADQLDAALTPAQRAAHPPWLLQALEHAWPEQLARTSSRPTTPRLR